MALSVSLTPNGLHIDEVILSEGLDPLEEEVIEALKNRSNYIYKNKELPTGNSLATK